jgi:hypothetical protein
MACKRSAVRSRLPPPKVRDETPSSRGLGPRPFTAVTGVRFPLGSPKQKRHPCDGVFVLRSPRGPIEPLGSTTQCPVDIVLDAARTFSRRARRAEGIGEAIRFLSNPRVGNWHVAVPAFLFVALPRCPIETLGSTTQCPVDNALDAARVFSRRARQGRGKRRGNPFSEHSLFCVVRFRAILCCFFVSASAP